MIYRYIIPHLRSRWHSGPERVFVDTAFEVPPACVVLDRGEGVAGRSPRSGRSPRGAPGGTPPSPRATRTVVLTVLPGQPISIKLTETFKSD